MIDNIYFVPLEEEKRTNWYKEIDGNILIIDPYFYLQGNDFKKVGNGSNWFFQYLEQE